MGELLFSVKSWVVLIFFLIFFIGFSLSRPSDYRTKNQIEFFGIETINSDTITYLERLKYEQPDISDLKTPFQYFLTKFVLTYFSIETILWLFPFITFFGSLTILLLIFDQMKFNPFLIPILLSWNIFWVTYYLNFGRDNWLFLFFSIMFYCMVQIEYFKKQKFWALMFIVIILAILTKIIGIIFIGIMLTFAIYKFSKIQKKLHFIVFPIGNVLNDYLSGLRSTEVTTLTSLSTIFITPIHTIAFFVALYLKNTFNYILIFWIIFSGHILYNLGHDGGTIYRYLFIFTPASLFIFAQFYKKMENKTNGFVSKRLAILIVLTIFFYLNNIARLVAQFGVRF